MFLYDLTFVVITEHTISLYKNAILLKWFSFNQQDYIIIYNIEHQDNINGENINP